MRRLIGPTLGVALLTATMLAASHTGPVASGWVRWDPPPLRVAAMFTGLGLPSFGGDQPGASQSFGDFLPDVDQTRNLGSASKSWGYVYAAALRDQVEGNNRVRIFTNDSSLVVGDIANSSTNAGVKVGNTNTLSGTTRILEFHNDSAMAAAESFVDNRGFYVTPAQAVSVADDGAGTSPASTLTPTSEYVSYTCSDANGCTVTLSETGALDGTKVRIVNVSANVCNFADTAGVTELAGAFAMGQWDSITLVYATDRWVELGRSNN